MMRLFAVCVLGLVLGAACADRDLRKLYKEWKVKFGRKDEGLKNDLLRYREFKRNAGTIDHINSIQKEWVAGFTLFADMTEDEKAQYLGLANETAPAMELEAPAADFDPTDLPKKYWEMGPAKNQWSCGSCWAFAAVAAVEGMMIKEHGEYKDLSEQSVLDCVYEGRRDGCNGGFSDDAIRWMGSNSKIAGSAPHGYLPYRSDNPYRGSDGECKDEKIPFPNGMKRARPTAWTARWKTQNDAGLQHALSTEGPVVVYIYSSWALPFYTTGTYQGTGCTGSYSINHAVVAAGYEKDYWYIKNSWGSSWGYSGYVYFTRSYPNLCKVSSSRKQITWNANQLYDSCKDTHPSERTPCTSDRILGEEECWSHGCCYDPTQAGTKNQCFANGQITLYNAKNQRRVVYGSVEYVSNLAFEAVAAEVQRGTWILYADGAWWNSPTRVVTKADGRVKMSIESVRVIADKNVLHLFEYYDYLGDIYTVSQSHDQLKTLNDDVSSYISFGSPWMLCQGTSRGAPCTTLGSETRVKNMEGSPLDDDSISSVYWKPQ